MDLSFMNFAYLMLEMTFAVSSIFKSIDTRVGFAWF